MPLKVLFASSEVFPLIKTGGLADVSGSLPSALQNLDVDIRVIIPGYPSVLEQLTNIQHLAMLNNLPAVDEVELLSGTIAENQVQVIVVKSALLYERGGGPYADVNGQEWQDNGIRFGVLSKVAAILSSQNTPLSDWRPDIVHCNDWQTGLIPAYMKLTDFSPAKSIISLHNMAFQGCYPYEMLATLGLPASAFQMEGLEYHGQLSFLKAGIYYADAITTVSPGYAQEIQTEAFGFGLQGLLATRSHEIIGILNGIEPEEWNPETDSYIPKNYSHSKLAGKKQVKKALQQKLRLNVDANAPLLGIVSRLTDQKGLDLFIPIAQDLLDAGCQLALLGSGDSELETAFRELATHNLGKACVTIGYNEPLSHQIMAGSDLFIMPSRFEPCGLNQLYGLAYGTIPVVNRTGGLADSIVDATPDTIRNKTATGFIMEDVSSKALLDSIQRGIAIYRNEPKVWRQLQKNGMSQNLSWDKSALQYLALYKNLTLEDE